MAELFAFRDASQHPPDLPATQLGLELFGFSATGEEQPRTLPKAA